MRISDWSSDVCSSDLLLNSGFFVCGFHVAFIATHLPAFVVDQGLGPAIGAWALGLVGLFNVAGSYTAGVLGGRRSKKSLLSSSKARRVGQECVSKRSSRLSPYH